MMNLDVKFRLSSQPPQREALILMCFRSCLGLAAESSALSEQNGKALPSNGEGTSEVCGS